MKPRYAPGDRLSISEAATFIAERDRREGETMRVAEDRNRKRIERAYSKSLRPEVGEKRIAFWRLIAWVKRSLPGLFEDIECQDPDIATYMRIHGSIQEGGDIVSGAAMVSTLSEEDRIKRMVELQDANAKLLEENAALRREVEVLRPNADRRQETNRSISRATRGKSKNL